MQLAINVALLLAALVPAYLVASTLAGQGQKVGMVLMEDEDDDFDERHSNVA